MQARSRLTRTDIGNPVLEALPVRTVRSSRHACLIVQRIADGMLQSAAVRSAGFAIVPLGETAPALQALFVVMMYIAYVPAAWPL